MARPSGQILVAHGAGVHGLGQRVGNVFDHGLQHAVEIRIAAVFERLREVVGIRMLMHAVDERLVAAKTGVGRDCPQLQGYGRVHQFKHRARWVGLQGGPVEQRHVGTEQ